MLYRFDLEISDVDRAVYESLSVRVAQHPSETSTYLLTRVLAYALNYRAGIEFSPGGLGDPDVPAVRVLGDHGAVEVWIDVGNPSTKRLHKASKASKQVLVYTYKSMAVLRDQIDASAIHRADDIRVYAVATDFLTALEARLAKSNTWSVLHQQGSLSVGIGAEVITGEIGRHTLT